MADPEADTRPGAEVAAPFPSLEEMQHWTWVMGRAQQLMMEHVAKQWGEAAPAATGVAAMPWPGMGLFADPGRIAKAQVDMWTEGLAIWQRTLGASGDTSEIAGKANRAKRFFAADLRQNRTFPLIRHTYLLTSARLPVSVDANEGLAANEREP